MTSFADLGLSQPVLRALADCGYDAPTPIQEQAIPIVAAGHDLIACAQTGTGKTAAFTLPLIDDIAKRPSGAGDMPLALVLTPTRELAQQIDENIRAYGKHVGTRTCVIVGGVSSGPQIKKLDQGVDFVIATPGRLIDLLEQKQVTLEDVDFLILDEADRMLDMGFIHDVRWIAEQVPTPRQTLLFSATVSPAIKSLASSMQTDPRMVSIAPPATVADNIEQQVMFVEKANKMTLLVDLLEAGKAERALVFTGSKASAARVARQLELRGLKAGAIHSDQNQNQRQRSLAAFAQGKVPILVATDIVARGIDVDDITQVINYELPNDAENYVHRIGRTARAGRSGVAVSLCGVEDVSRLRGVQRVVKEPLQVKEDHQWHSPTVAACLAASARKSKSNLRGRRGGLGR